jgi:hypothetical protein
LHERHLNKGKEELLKRSVERDRHSWREYDRDCSSRTKYTIRNILREFINERSSGETPKMDSSKIIKAATYSREVVKKLMFFSCEMPQHMKFVKVVPLLSLKH